MKISYIGDGQPRRFIVLTPEENALAAAMDVAGHGLTFAIDQGAGDDRTVYSCPCGYHTESLEAMIRHAGLAHDVKVTK